MYSQWLGSDRTVVADVQTVHSVPPLKMYVRYTVLVQIGNKDKVKIVHVTSVG